MTNDIKKIKEAIMTRIESDGTPKCADDIIKLSKFYFELDLVEKENEFLLNRFKQEKGGQ